MNDDPCKDTGPSDENSPRLLNALFNGPGDVVILSADNVEFHLYQKYLEYGAKGFPPAGTPTDPNDLPRLPESSEILQVLFQFMYPQHYPSLNGLEFEKLMLLAEAAEKYEVFALRNACQFQLRLKFIHKDPKRLLEFAVQHNHRDLILELAPILVETPLSELEGILSLPIHKAWSHYRENWLLAMQRGVSKKPQHWCGRPTWDQYTCTWLQRLNTKLYATPGMSRIDFMFQGYHVGSGLQDCCCSTGAQWKASIKAELDAIPPLDLTQDPWRREGATEP